jgi:PAS domain S-box-containing protein
MRKLAKNDEVVITQANISMRKASELMLRKSEERFRSLFERTSDGLVFLNESGVIENFNPSFLSLTGYNGEELTGRPAIEFIPKEDIADFEVRSEKRAKGESENYEARIIDKKGRVIEIEVSAVPQYNEDGQFFGTLSMIRDISRRKAKEREERAQYLSHEVFNKLLQIEIRNTELKCILAQSLDLISELPFFGDRAGIAFFYWDRKGGRIEFSKGCDLSSIHKCFLQEKGVCLCRSALDKNELLLDGRINKELSCFWGDMATRNCPIIPILTGGRVRGFFAIQNVILAEIERELLNNVAGILGKTLWEKEIQEKIQESEMRLLGIINNSSEITVILDCEGIVKFVSPAIVQILGYEMNDVLGTCVFDYFHKDDKEKATTAFQKRLHLGGIGEYETYRLKTKKGHYKYLRTITSNNIETQGIEGFIVNAHDITFLKQAERDKHLTIIRTEESERRRISRDLHDGVGQSVAASTMYFNTLDFFAKEQLSKEAYEIFKTGKKIINRAAQEVRIVSHNIMPPSLKHFGFVETLRELITDYQTLSDSKFDVQFVENFGGYRLDQDLELTLYRVMQELLNNAFKHSKAKTISVDIQLESGDLFIRVVDNGIGFSLDDMKSRKDTGIGMISVYQRVEAIGGELTIDSKKGDGTSIILKLNNPTIV